MAFIVETVERRYRRQGAYNYIVFARNVSYIRVKLRMQSRTLDFRTQDLSEGELEGM